MKRICVLTSGGDAPGMNAAIRSVVRTASNLNLEVYGIKSGYNGLIDGHFIKMSSRDVSNIIQRGGTILKTSRSKRFLDKKYRKIAIDFLNREKIDGLVVIGGNGSFLGAKDLSQEWEGKVIGVPATIDNDIFGTDFTIGYDTAVNTALSAIDKIRDTADSHERYFVIEVMGRHSGFIGVNVAIGSGAEIVVVPEKISTIENISSKLESCLKIGKTSSIVILSEGTKFGSAIDFSKELHKTTGKEYRAVILGHLQRGGSPLANDRMLATRLGAYSVELLNKGITAVAVGEEHFTLTNKTFEDICSKHKNVNNDLMNLINGMAV